MDAEAPESTAEPLAELEERAYRALLRSLSWLCEAEVWKYVKCSRHKGKERDRLLLSRMKTKDALQLLEIRKTATMTLARVVRDKKGVLVPPEVPAAGKDKMDVLLDRLDDFDTFEEVDAEIKRLRREGEISRSDANALLQDAREKHGLEPETEEEHTVEDEIDDLMETAVLQAAASKEDQ